MGPVGDIVRLCHDITGGGNKLFIDHYFYFNSTFIYSVEATDICSWNSQDELMQGCQRKTAR